MQTGTSGAALEMLLNLQRAFQVKLSIKIAVDQDFGFFTLHDSISPPGSDEASLQALTTAGKP